MSHTKQVTLRKKLPEENHFDEIADFYIPSKSDYRLIMDFYKAHWNKNHILATNVDFFMYEHGCHDQINFIFSTKKGDPKEIQSITGFLRYTPESPQLTNISAVMSKTAKTCKIPMIGLEINRRVSEYQAPRTFCGINTNPQTMGQMSAHLGRTFGLMQHFAVSNPSINPCNTTLSALPTTISREKLLQPDLEAVPIRHTTDLYLCEHLFKVRPELPYKSINYVIRRYQHHPIYQYSIFQIMDGKQAISLVITRAVSHNGSSALRIIDYIGEVNMIEQSVLSLGPILLNNNYEYIDMLAAGLDDNGLSLEVLINTKLHDIRIPTHFEPYDPTPKDIWCERSHPKLILFKGDADGDRPNQG